MVVVHVRRLVLYVFLDIAVRLSHIRGDALGYPKDSLQGHSALSTPAELHRAFPRDEVDRHIFGLSLAAEGVLARERNK